jgi:MATE family multidrug resistance protein
MNEFNQHGRSFAKNPHRTFISLTFPVLLSLVAEPITGLVDTAFVARFGPVSLAALGVGTMSLSSVFWIFNFLGIGTQTEVSQSFGKSSLSDASRVYSLAVMLGLSLGFLLIVAGFPAAEPVAKLMGASGQVAEKAQSYIRYRLLGAPAVLVSFAAFGTLRGLQDMRTPLFVAILVNAINIVLDAILIFGWGPIPTLGIKGAAIASSISWWVGAIWAVMVVWRRLGLTDRIPIEDVIKLFQVGRDLIIRTGLLSLFLLLATRTATLVGPEAGAAHQVIRQVWVFTNLFLDAFAITGQSLIGFYIGGGFVIEARRVAGIVCLWSAIFGVVLAAAMWLGRNIAVTALVPPTAVGLFLPAWMIAAIIQPVSALSFATDGIHWGTGDFRYLRNVVLLATVSGGILLAFIDLQWTYALMAIWVITGIWVLLRALFGILRIWPGVGKSPLTNTEG